MIWTVQLFSGDIHRNTVGGFPPTNRFIDYLCKAQPQVIPNYLRNITSLENTSCEKPSLQMPSLDNRSLEITSHVFMAKKLLITWLS